MQIQPAISLWKFVCNYSLKAPLRLVRGLFFFLIYLENIFVLFLKIFLFSLVYLNSIS